MDLSDIGPVEYAVMAFPGNRFRGEIAAELLRLTDQGVIHIIDLTFIKRAADGSVQILELDALDAEEAELFARIDGEVSGLLSDEDLQLIAEEIPADCSAAILVWEDTWATGLAKAVRRADGILIAHERVPASIVERDVAAIAT
ncbi:DUF6325 family protein [Peterkaempfera sp. SMS 1(5)a]|uniref:DUF6325 family protein n=1 Tax=Peterkaempfera podocarpi TaxID=3232308 RepID=UPI00366F747D